MRMVACPCNLAWVESRPLDKSSPHLHGVRHGQRAGLVPVRLRGGAHAARLESEDRGGSEGENVCTQN